MAVVTLGRLSEEILRMLSGGEIQAAKNISINEIKISIGQVANSVLKSDYLKINLKTGETIPNGTMVALYENISVVQSNGVSKATLPIKPVQLKRNIGIYGIYPKFATNDHYDTSKEFIPLQMGQSGLLGSQPLLNDLLGQIGYENFGNEIIFTKDLLTLYPNIKLAMRLVIMDISQYGDYDILPILPEQEWQIKQEVLKIYSNVGTPDKLVDSTTKSQQNVPVNQQKQS